jgi:hypothetical protein
MASFFVQTAHFVPWPPLMTRRIPFIFERIIGHFSPPYFAMDHLPPFPSSRFATWSACSWRCDVKNCTAKATTLARSIDAGGRPIKQYECVIAARPELDGFGVVGRQWRSPRKPRSANLKLTWLISALRILLFAAWPLLPFHGCARGRRDMGVTVAPNFSASARDRVT